MHLRGTERILLKEKVSVCVREREMRKTPYLSRERHAQKEREQTGEEERENEGEKDEENVEEGERER